MFKLCAYMCAWLQFYVFVVILWQTVCVFDHARNMYPGMLMFIGPPFWSRLKYLNKYELDYHEIWYKHLWSPDDEYKWV